MARFTSKTKGLERISGYGQVISCPLCNKPFMLKDTKDGDQAYWCHSCERGWRAGHLPPEARVARKALAHEETPSVKAKALLDAPLEPELNRSRSNGSLEAVLGAMPAQEPSPACETQVQTSTKPRTKTSTKPKPEVSRQRSVALQGQQSLFEVSR
jgi:hypothetical protein